jgi:hypothetical protein
MASMLATEWSEGCYLEPDERYRFQRLQAIKEVFGLPMHGV